MRPYVAQKDKLVRGGQDRHELERAERKRGKKAARQEAKREARQYF